MTVQFMSQWAGYNGISKAILVNEPFLRARFGKTGSADNSGQGNEELKNEQLAPDTIKNQRRNPHGYPKILALGILLLEIQFDGRLESPYYHDQDPDIAKHLIARAILDDKSFWLPKNIWVMIKEIIEICIYEDRAKEVLGDDSLNLRQKLHEEIVAPFRFFIQETLGSEGIKNVDRITLENKPVITPLRSPTTMHNTIEEEASSEARIEGALSTESVKLSEGWLNNLNSFTRRLSFNGERDLVNCPHIKVAILDTGITAEYYEEFGEYIQGYKDFLSENDDLRQDGSGHGSTALRLLLKLNDNVKVFVGRVFKRNEADGETERVMAEAIIYAKREWKVDIICIPSGFDPNAQEQPYRHQLYRAVTAAPEHESDPTSLIFTAASNLGFNNQVTFPACLSTSSKVLCFFATNGRGEPARFNPRAIPRTYNFALLGEGIQIDPMDPPIGGTSFSTMIAAAIAAYIMDFANHPETMGKIKDVQYLREVEGMASVFASMCWGERENYHVLSPWLLGIHSETVELSREENREAICRNISRALQDRDSCRRLL
ncbi:peptidase S8/S53 domain-containing protein [Trichoderma chlorosporum]